MCKLTKKAPVFMGAAVVQNSISSMVVIISPWPANAKGGRGLCR